MSCMHVSEAYFKQIAAVFSSCFRSGSLPDCRVYKVCNCLAMPFTEDQLRIFEAHYDTLCSAEDSKLVSIADTMIDLLVRSGEAQVKHIHPKLIVPHLENRNSTLMTEHKIQPKGGKILGVGFSLSKCDPKRAVCFGRNPVGNADVERFVNHSNGNPFMATFDASTVEGLSVGCGHLNQFLACVHDEVAIIVELRKDPDIVGTSADSVYFNKDDIVKRDSMHGSTQLKTALEIGIKWTFIPHRIAVKYPRLPAKLCQSLNVEHNIGEGESWEEQLLSLSRPVVDHYKTNNSVPNYRAIQRDVLKSKPARALDVPAMMQFVKTWGGGKSQCFVTDIVTYVKTKPSSGVVGGNIFDIISKLQFPTTDMCPSFIAACIKCAATRGGIRGGVSSHLSESDIKSIPKAEGVAEANQYIVKALAIDKQLGGTFGEVRGDMECDLVDVVLKKVSNDDQRTIASIIENFIQHVSGTQPQSRAGSSTDAEEHEEIFDPSANVGMQTLRNLGFTVGSLLQLKQAGANEANTPRADKQWEIGYINDENVGLYPIASDGSAQAAKVLVVSQVQLTSNYKLDKRDRLSMVEPDLTNIAHTSFVNSVANIGVHDAFFQHEKCPKDAIYLQKTPVLKLIAKQDLAKAALVFVSWAPTVKLAKNQPLKVEVLGKEGAPHGIFAIDKPNFKDFDFAMFWRLRKLSDKDECNMKLVSVEVKVPVPKIDKTFAKTLTVMVPAAVLDKDVKEGDELVLFTPKPEDRAPKATCLKSESEPVAKKQRSS